MTVALKVWQEGDDKAEQVILKDFGDNYSFRLDDKNVLMTIKRVIMGMRSGEISNFVIKNEYVSDEDTEDVLKIVFGDSYVPEKDIHMRIHLKEHIKIEDWFRDGGKTTKKTLRHGRGRAPYEDSTCFFRMKIEINKANENSSQVILNNYPGEEEKYDLISSESLRDHKFGEERKAWVDSIRDSLY